LVAKENVLPSNCSHHLYIPLAQIGMMSKAAHIEIH